MQLRPEAKWGAIPPGAPLTPPNAVSAAFHEELVRCNWSLYMIPDSQASGL